MQDLNFLSLVIMLSKDLIRRIPALVEAAVKEVITLL